MRFSDMVLVWVATPTKAAVSIIDLLVSLEKEVAEAQHEADMGEKIACPFGRADTPAWCPTDCACCSGTGRVTLGALVAADRAKKEKIT